MYLERWDYQHSLELKRGPGHRGEKNKRLKNLKKKVPRIVARGSSEKNKIMRQLE